MNTLRQFVRRVLVEKMMTPQDASSQGFALTFVNNGDETWAVLYNPKEATAKMQELGGSELEADQVTQCLEQSVVGTIMFAQAVRGNCYGAYEVMRSAARPGAGAGPLMYYIAMAVAPSHTLISDRDSVSADAAKVWQKFDKSVERLKLDDESNPQTEDPADDCAVHNDPQRAFLDFAYKSDNVQLDLGGLKSRHDEFVTDLGFSLDNLDESAVEQAFQAAAKGFFQSSMGG